MGIVELIVLGLALSMDAFAVSVCKGLSVGKAKLSHAAIAGLYFGGFQALMPLLGYLAGSAFEKYITKYDHWITFALLVLIGLNMIHESRGEGESCNTSFGFKTMLPFALATSVDALAVGVSFAFLNVNIWLAIAIIGAITFVVSFVGVRLGSVLGKKNKSRAEMIGGIILIAIGTKILIEHLIAG